MGRLNFVPWTHYTSFWTGNAIRQRSGKMCAVGIESINLVLDLHDEYLSALSVFRLGFLPVAVMVLEARQVGDTSLYLDCCAFWLVLQHVMISSLLLRPLW